MQFGNTSKFKVLSKTVSKWQFILALFSTLVFVAGLYELDAVFTALYFHSAYCIPFFFICSYDYVFWKNWWIAHIVLGYVLLIYSIWKWE